MTEAALLLHHEAASRGWSLDWQFMGLTPVQNGLKMNPAWLSAKYEDQGPSYMPKKGSWNYYVSPHGSNHGFIITDGLGLELSVDYAWQAEEICKAHNKTL